MSTFGKFYRNFHVNRYRPSLLGGNNVSVRSNNKIWRCAPVASFHSTHGLEGSIPIKMPKLSPTMEQGTIVKWYKNEGDVIAPGDVLCDVETDKATVALDVEEEGILAKIIVPKDARDIKIGKLIAVMVEEGEDWQNAEIPADTDSAPVSQSEDSSPATPSDKDVKPQTSNIHQNGHLLGPAVKNLLELYPITINDVPGSGRSGLVMKGDVLKVIKDKSLKPQQKDAPPPKTPDAAAAPAAPRPVTAPVSRAAYQDIELTGMRRTIAKRLTESKTCIPHTYSVIDCTVDEVVALRKQLVQDGIKLSMNDFVIKAAAMALRQVPEVNATWTGGGVALLPTVDISVAVATRSGLITPIVWNADHLGLQQISQTVKELSQRTRAGELKPEEFIGGSFTISNLGMFGITEFTAVINPPQSCVMAVGTSQTIFHDGNPKNVMRVTISSDSRVIDDSLAARFLSAFKRNLEMPEMMQLGRSAEPEFLDMDAL